MIKAMTVMTSRAHKPIVSTLDLRQFITEWVTWLEWRLERPHRRPHVCLTLVPLLSDEVKKATSSISSSAIGIVIVGLVGVEVDVGVGTLTPIGQTLIKRSFHI